MVGKLRWHVLRCREWYRASSLLLVYLFKKYMQYEGNTTHSKLKRVRAHAGGASWMRRHGGAAARGSVGVHQSVHVRRRHLAQEAPVHRAGRLLKKEKKEGREGDGEQTVHKICSRVASSERGSLPWRAPQPVRVPIRDARRRAWWARVPGLRASRAQGPRTRRSRPPARSPAARRSRCPRSSSPPWWPRRSPRAAGRCPCGIRPRRETAGSCQRRPLLHRSRWTAGSAWG